MNKSTILSAVAAACLLGLTATAFAAVKGEFNDMCTMGLALGKQVKTDCSINEKIDGKTYCFGNAEARTMFNKAQKENLAKAETTYKSLKH